MAIDGIGGSSNAGLQRQATPTGEKRKVAPAGTPLWVYSQSLHRVKSV